MDTSSVCRHAPITLNPAHHAASRPRKLTAPSSQVPRSQCTSSLTTILGFIVAYGSRLARQCAVVLASRSWWRSRSIGECLESHCPTARTVLRPGSRGHLVSPPPRWHMQLCGPRSSSSRPNFLIGQRPPSSTPTPSISSCNDMCVFTSHVVSFVSDRFAPPLCGLCLEFGANLVRSRCLRAKLRPVVCGL